MKHSMFISVVNEFKGFHRWPDAPDSVEFLRHPHRHVFKFKSTVEVRNKDRDIEFFALQERIAVVYFNGFLHENGTYNFQHRSCEQLVYMVAMWLSTVYPNRQIMVTCSEDGENEATIILKEDEDEEAVLSTA